MEREIATRFLDKRIAFQKNGEPHTLTGFLKEVTEFSILIEFKGRLQAHKLDDIDWIEEAVNNGGGGDGN